MRAVLCAVLLALAVVLAACTPQSTGGIVLDPDPCIDAQDKDWCYVELSGEGRTFACPLIGDERTRSLCYVEVVKWDPKEEHCLSADVSDQHRKYCYAELGIALEDYGVCDKSEGDSREYCRMNVMRAKNEPDKCDTLTVSSWKNECFGHFGRLLGDKIMCFKVSSESGRDNCVYDVALSTNDVELCHSIVNTQAGAVFEKKRTTVGCVNDLAIMNKDVALCDEIVESVSGDLCRARVAVAADDVRLCDEVGAQIVRDRCIARISGTNSTEE